MSVSVIESLSAEIGQTWNSDWLTVDQTMIDGFADVTGDRQFIHVDPVRAAATPFGGTVAHGFLTLSLLSQLVAAIDRPPTPGIKLEVNYGFDQIRFLAQVRSGSRVRGVFTLRSIQEKRPNQFQQILDCTVEIDGGDKPALAAVWITQFFT